MRFAVPNTVHKTDIGNNNLAVGPSGSHDCSSQLQRRERTHRVTNLSPYRLIWPRPPPDCLKSPGESWKVCTPIQGDFEFSILTGGTFTFKTVSPRLSEKSRREQKSPYTTTGATTNSQSSEVVLLLLRQSLPVTAWQPRWGTGERIPRTPFGRFAPSLVAFSASFWGLYESVISMILTVWRL